MQRTHKQSASLLQHTLQQFNKPTIPNDPRLKFISNSQIQSNNFMNSNLPSKNQRTQNATFNSQNSQFVSSTQNKVPEEALDRSLVNQQGLQMKESELASQSNKSNLELQPQYLMKSGKFYGEEFKRNVVLEILQRAEEHKDRLDEITKQVANKIEIHPFEVRIWINAFRIIFKIEDEIEAARRSYQWISRNEKIQKVKKQILTYMMKNKGQKKYRLVKMVQEVFRNLNLPDPRASGWVNEFVLEHRNQLYGIDFSQYTRDYSLPPNYYQSVNEKKKKGDTKMETDSPSQSSDADLMNGPPFKQRSQALEKIRQKLEQKCQMAGKEQGQTFSELGMQKRSKSEIIAQKRLRKQFSGGLQEDESIKIYPEAFKKNIASKIDQHLKNCVSQAIRMKSQELCLPVETIQKIHSFYGILSERNISIFLSEQQQLPNSESDVQSYPTKGTKQIQRNETKNFVWIYSGPFVKNFNQKMMKVNFMVILNGFKMYLKLENHLKKQMELYKDKPLNLSKENRYACKIKYLQKKCKEITIVLGIGGDMLNDIQSRWVGKFLIQNEKRESMVSLQAESKPCRSVIRPKIRKYRLVDGKLS